MLVRPLLPVARLLSIAFEPPGHGQTQFSKGTQVVLRGIEIVACQIVAPQFQMRLIMHRVGHLSQLLSGLVEHRGEITLKVSERRRGNCDDLRGCGTAIGRGSQQAHVLFISLGGIAQLVLGGQHFEQSVVLKEIGGLQGQRLLDVALQLCETAQRELTSSPPIDDIGVSGPQRDGLAIGSLGGREIAGRHLLKSDGQPGIRIIRIGGHRPLVVIRRHAGSRFEATGEVENGRVVGLFCQPIGIQLMQPCGAGFIFGQVLDHAVPLDAHRPGSQPRLQKFSRTVGLAARSAVCAYDCTVSLASGVTRKCLSTNANGSVVRRSSVGT